MSRTEEHFHRALVDCGVNVTTRSIRGALIALFIALTSATSGGLSAAEPSDADARVRAEIARLGRSLEEKPLVGADLEGLSSACQAALRASADALDAGRLYSSLESLGRAADLIHGTQFAVEKEASLANDLAAFDREWSEASRVYAALGAGRGNRAWRHSRAAVRALAESAEGKVAPLLEGARGFAVAKGPKEGLFYMGQAGGAAELAAFSASLTFRDKVKPYPLRSMLPELQRLQEKATAAFQPPRSIDLHSRFIALNSSLKAGLELDAAQSYAGSAYHYLEAVRHHAMLDAAPLDGPGQARVREDLAAAHTRIDASQRDESLAELFLERAASQVSHPDGSDPSADEWRSARVILDQVLPAYFAADVPVARSRASSRNALRMTLLRWPYT